MTPSFQDRSLNIESIGVTDTSMPNVQRINFRQSANQAAHDVQQLRPTPAETVAGAVPSCRSGLQSQKRWQSGLQLKCARLCVANDAMSRRSAGSGRWSLGVTLWLKMSQSGTSAIPAAAAWRWAGGLTGSGSCPRSPCREQNTTGPTAFVAFGPAPQVQMAPRVGGLLSTGC